MIFFHKKLIDLCIREVDDHGWHITYQMKKAPLLFLCLPHTSLSYPGAKLKFKDEKKMWWIPLLNSCSNLTLMVNQRIS